MSLIRLNYTFISFDNISINFNNFYPIFSQETTRNINSLLGGTPSQRTATVARQSPPADGSPSHTLQQHELI